MSTAEIINTLFRKFGANRVEVEIANIATVEFSMRKFGYFIAFDGGYVSELAHGRSAKAIWLESVIRGKTRNDSGEMA